MALDQKKRRQFDLDFREGKARKERRDAVRAVEAVLKSQDGRDALWHILSETGLFADTLYRSGVEINVVVARRDFGMWLAKLIGEADANALFSMQRAGMVKLLNDRIEYDTALEKLMKKESA